MMPLYKKSHRHHLRKLKNNFHYLFNSIKNNLKPKPMPATLPNYAQFCVQNLLSQNNTYCIEPVREMIEEYKQEPAAVTENTYCMFAKSLDVGDFTPPVAFASLDKLCATFLLCPINPANPASMSFDDGAITHLISCPAGTPAVTGELACTDPLNIVLTNATCQLINVAYLLTGV